jgi:putative zinc finger/helix-turn-helix YgiT family protein
MSMGDIRGKDRCSNCGQPASRIRRNYLFRESGLSNAVLKDIQIVTCDHCGNEDPIIPRLSEVIRVLASATVRKPRPLTGQDVRFLRKQMDMNGETFARHLGVDKTTLSKWENDQIPIGANSDRLIRAVVLGLGPDSKAEIESGIRSFIAIDEEGAPVRIEIDARSLAFSYA